MAKWRQHHLKTQYAASDSTVIHVRSKRSLEFGGAEDPMSKIVPPPPFRLPVFCGGAADADEDEDEDEEGLEKEAESVVSESDVELALVLLLVDVMTVTLGVGETLVVEGVEEVVSSAASVEVVDVEVESSEEVVVVGTVVDLLSASLLLEGVELVVLLLEEVDVVLGVVLRSSSCLLPAFASAEGAAYTVFTVGVFVTTAGVSSCEA